MTPPDKNVETSANKMKINGNDAKTAKNASIRPPTPPLRTTQTRAVVSLAFVFLTTIIVDGLDEKIYRTPEPRRPFVSRIEAERSRAPKALANAVAELAPTSPIVETGAKTALESSRPTVSDSDGKLRFVVNLNAATKSELTNLPKIGDALAERILEYRDANDGFSSVDELGEIKGIGAKTLEKLRPYCVVETSSERQ